MDVACACCIGTREVETGGSLGLLARHSSQSASDICSSLFSILWIHGTASLLTSCKDCPSHPLHWLPSLCSQQGFCRADSVSCFSVVSLSFFSPPFSPPPYFCSPSSSFLLSPSSLTSSSFSVLVDIQAFVAECGEQSRIFSSLAQVLSNNKI